MPVLILGALTEQILVWDTARNSLENSQSLEQIAQWWTKLDGVLVRWNGWFFPCTLNPMLVQQFILKETQITGSGLHWRLDDSPGAFSLAPSKMVLDTEFQTLDIIIRTKRFNGDLEQKHRVEVVKGEDWSDRRRSF
jgi:integral membrane sensor domain MASE1